jgi:DNA-binding transcriptional MerR regulator
MVREQGYYSVRTGKHPNGARLDLASLKKIFLSVDRQFRDRGFFQEAFGYNCVDAGDVPGTLGEDIEGTILIALRKNDIWPIWQQIDAYAEDDLFDVIEFLFDNVSKPVDDHFHNFNNCGMHYSSFNRSEGQQEFRTILNPILAAYEEGFTLSENGEMLTMPEAGMSQLLEANLPKFDPENIEERVQAATNRFRRYKASLEDRKHALRDLADVLEYLRPKIQTALLSKDEADLFNLANNFGIRHHNEKQKTGYDPAIWYSWMFYYYLATIHACVRLIAKKK